MAENGAEKGENELKLLEIIKEKNEKIEQLEKTLNAKDVLHEAVQLECETKDNLLKFLKEKLRQLEVPADGIQVEAELMKKRVQMDAEKSDENERKVTKEIVQVEENLPENKVDSDLDSQASAAEAPIKIATIPLILIKVLKNMGTRDLLENCRLVSREWRDFSTEILLKQTKFRIKFHRLRDGKFAMAFRHVVSRKLEDLTAFLSTSKTKSFPCAHFVFKGNLKSDDAQAFLSNFGSRVKGLKLNGPQNLQCIRNLLVEQIPHLEFLELSGFVEEENSNPVPTGAPAPQMLSRLFPPDSPAPHRKLSSLTSIKLGNQPHSILNSSSLVQEILNAAPNLQEVFGISTTQEIECLSSRIHVVKGLNIKRDNPDGVLSIGNLHKMMPILQQFHLTSLEFDYSSGSVRPLTDEDASICKSISKILTTSKSSLKKIKFTFYPKFDGVIEWPELEKVGKLSVVGDLPRVIPRLFTRLENENETGVSKIFPNLHTIRLILRGFQFIKDEHGFDHLPRIPTVKTLKIYRPDTQTLWLFLPLFPNVKHLVLDKVDGFAYFAPKIWEMKGLKSLEIDFNCAGSEIDAGFTGLGHRICELLRIYQGRKFPVEEVDGFSRRLSSILVAKELEHLFLPRGFSLEEEFSGNPLNYQKQDFSRATCVSFKYAFNLMPKLRVFPHRNR